jgi:CDP-diglyceride synthetase
MDIDASTLFLHVVIVALSAIGVVEWLKNKVKCKKKSNYAFIGLFQLAVNVTMQMPFIADWLTTWYNVFMLGVAVMQLGHHALVKVPEMLINKAMGISNNSPRGERQ